MVKIRYAELPAGLHVTAAGYGRDTIVYLLPGLTPAQRRAALSRVRSSARMGYGPRLPGIAVARALAADRARMTARYAAAAMRGHPGLLLPRIAGVSAAIVLALFSFVTLTTHPADRPAGSNLPATVSTPGQYGSQNLYQIARPPIDQRERTARDARQHRRASRDGQAGYQYPSESGWSSARPSRSDPWRAPAPDPSPTAHGKCIKLGPLGLCVRV